MGDRRFSHESHFEAMDTIDACLFTGCPDSYELDAIEEYIHRWQIKIKEQRSFLCELEEEVRDD